MRKLLTYITALLLALTVAGPAHARAERIPFEAQEVTIAVPDPGRSWVSGGIEHTWGLTLIYEATSDILASAAWAAAGVIGHLSRTERAGADR